MKNRVRQRANHKKKVREQMLERRNDYGAKDLTKSSAALRCIVKNGNATITVKKRSQKVSKRAAAYTIVL